MISVSGRSHHINHAEMTFRSGIRSSKKIMRYVRNIVTESCKIFWRNFIPVNLLIPREERREMVERWKMIREGDLRLSTESSQETSFIR